MRRPQISPNHQPRAAVFDFDLTLADSTHAVGACIDHALPKMGFDPVGPERARRTIGLSLEETFKELTGESDPEDQARFRELFIQQADLVMVGQTHLLEGTAEAVDRLRNAGIRLGIVSTKYRFRIMAILERFQLLDRFEVIVGGEDVADHKPAPEGLLLALDALGIGGDEAVYVGDHRVDAEAAMLASVPFVGVSSGESGPEEFEKYPKIGVLDGVFALPEFLEGLREWPPSPNAWRV